jgi:hypothetical protein
MAEPKEDIRKGFNYPNEVRDAVILESYSESTFATQSITDFIDMLNFCARNHEEIIKNFEEGGGVIEHDTDEEGNEDPHRFLFYIGHTLFFVQFDDGFHIIDMGIRWDLVSTPKNRHFDLDIEMILQTATAIFYRDNPEKAVEWLNDKNIDVWNTDVVRGLQKKADKITMNELVTAYFLSGTDIETIDKLNNHIVGKPIPPTTEKKTEYSDV